MVESPFLERLARMEFGIPDRPADRPTLLDLLASPRLAALAELDVTSDHTGGLLADLSRQPAVPSLSSVCLEQLTDEDVASTLASLLLSGLTDVGDFDGLSRAALADLLRTPDRWLGLGLGFAELAAPDLHGLAACGRLRRLDLRWPGGAVLPLPPSLDHLTIHSVLDRGPPPAVVARSLGQAGLRHLEYRWQPPNRTAGPDGWEGLGALLATLPGPVLALTLSNFAADPLPQLSRLPALGNLRSLELALCDLTDAGLDALAGCEGLTGLRRMKCESWRPEHLPRLAQASLLEGLRVFSVQGSIQGNGQADFGTEAFIRGVLNREPSPEMIARGDEAAVAFLRSPRLKRLQRLEMKGISGGPRTVELLAGWPGLRRLRHLTLYFNGLTDSVMEPLRRHLGLRLRY
jgi:hypothetical protein